MIGEAIHDDTLKALVNQHVICDVVVGLVAGYDQQWTLSVRLGGPTAQLIPVRSRREPLRIWKSPRPWPSTPTLWALVGLSSSCEMSRGQTTGKKKPP